MKKSEIRELKTADADVNNAVIAYRSKVIERFGAANIAKWKAEHNAQSLSVIAVEDKMAILRPITPAEFSHYSLMVADPQGGMDVASRYLLEELWIDGDDEIRNDDDYFIAAMLQLQNAIELKKSGFMKL